MTGGLYRSAHAARDGDPTPPATRPWSRRTSRSRERRWPTSQALPPEEPGQSTTGQSAIMAAGSLVSRIIGFVRNALIGMTLGAAVGDAYTSAQFLPSQIYELLLGGILSSVLIPLLVRRRKADSDGGQAYTQKLLTFAVVCSGHRHGAGGRGGPVDHRHPVQRPVLGRRTRIWSPSSPT